MRLLVLCCVLGLAAYSQALNCYTCKPSKDIARVSISGATLTAIKAAPLCSEFDAGSPDNSKFLSQCPTSADKACLKVTDPNDSANQMRGCLSHGKPGCKENMCYCDTDMCNGAGPRGWPSAALLLLLPLAVILGAR